MKNTNVAYGDKFSKMYLLELMSGVEGRIIS